MNKAVIILDKESKSFERGIKEAIHNAIEHLSINWGGGLKHNLTGDYQSIITTLKKKLEEVWLNSEPRPSFTVWWPIAAMWSVGLMILLG